MDGQERIVGLLKVNYFPHQMAITLTENGFLERNQKS
jgi:hypothetical protein